MKGSARAALPFGIPGSAPNLTSVRLFEKAERASKSPVAVVAAAFGGALSGALFSALAFRRFRQPGQDVAASIYVPPIPREALPDLQLAPVEQPPVPSRSLVPAEAGPHARAASRPRIFYGWWLLAALTVIMTIGPSMTWGSFTFYITPLEAEFGWSRTQTSIAAVITQVLFAASAPCVGWWIDHRGARSAMLTGTVLTSIGFVALSTTSQLWQYYVYWAFVAFWRTWIAWIPATILAARWFNRRRGMALGIVTAGVPIGNIIVLPYLAAVIERMGWQTGFLMTAVAVPVVFLPITLLLVRERPESMGLEPDGGAAPPATARAHHVQHEFTASEAVRTRAFWIMTLGFLFMYMGGDSFAPHQAPFFESRGFSIEGAARVLAVVALVQLIMRATALFFVDRIPQVRLLMSVPSIFLGLGIAAVMISTDLAGLASFVVFFGFGQAVLPMGETLIRARYFGTRALGRLTGINEMLNVGGVFIGPILGGVIFDRTGDYGPALLFYAGSLVFAGVVYAFAAPPRPPRSAPGALP